MTHESVLVTEPDRARPALAARPPLPSRARALSALRAGPDPLRMLQALAGDQPLVRVGPPGRHALLVSSPAAVRQVLRDSPGSYGKPGFVKKGQVGILVSDGEEWAVHRRLVQQAFTPPRVEAMRPLLESAVGQTAHRWEDASRERATLDVLSEMRALSWRMLCRLLLGEDAASPSLTARLWRAVRSSHVDRNPVAMLLDARRGGSARPAAEELGGIIASWRTRPDDGVTVVAGLTHATDSQGRRLSDAEVYDEVLSLLTAGHETTADTLAWTWQLLSRSPDVADRVAAEGRGRSVREANGGLRQQSVTAQVLNETLRLYPPIWLFGRTALTDQQLAGLTVRAGTTLLVSPWLLHRDPREWPDPDRFDPARFGAAAPAPSRLCYLPFGSGPRVCVGSRLAMLEMQLALSALSAVARLEPVGRWVRPRLAVTLRPAGPVPMRLLPRSA